MAILCLARDADDFMNRVNNIMVAYSSDNKPIFKIAHFSCGDEINVAALNPNLVQTQGNRAYSRRSIRYCSWLQFDYRHEDGFKMILLVTQLASART